MEMTTKLAEISAMPVGDRIQLVQAIWDSIEAEEVPSEPSESQKADLGRRMKELDENPQNVLTWEQIEAHVRGRT
ncbi:MAG: addiction module protein [Planctomycetia bacterium]|nr:addiction module protein [Planctomycetia bacterium]